jgi:RNA polymerase sigma-70 factor, ECF subfamily
MKSGKNFLVIERADQPLLINASFRLDFRHPQQNLSGIFSSSADFGIELIHLTDALFFVLTCDIFFLMMSKAGSYQMERDEFLRLVYQELRFLAQSYLRQERVDHTLQPTALVHEAYLRLAEQQNIVWRNREHFIGVAATMMRRILVNHAVRRKRDKHGSGNFKLSLAEADRFTVSKDVNLIALDEALEKLAKDCPQVSRIVELKFFGGLSTMEIAKILGVSDRTVEREWKFARTWLLREING